MASSRTSPIVQLETPRPGNLGNGAHRQSRRIAHLTTVDLSLRFLLLPQLRALQQDGYHVTGLCAPGPWCDSLRAAGLPIITLRHLHRGRYGGADLLAMREIAQVLQRERFDLLHTHTPKAGLLGRVAARLAGQPHVIHTIHGLPANAYSSRLRHALVWAIERLGAACSEHVLLQNAEDLETVRRTHMVPKGRYSLLGNGVDVTRFSPSSVSASDSAALREELGLPPNQPVVGMVARLIERKGYQEFFRAAEVLKQEYPECTFLCAGPLEPSQSDGIPHAQLQQLQDRGIVLYAGVRPDIEQLYALMDIVVLPSYYPEGVPRSLMEPAAMGKPLITTNTRGCRDVVEDGVNGLLVSAQNPKALIGAIRRLLQQPSLRTDYGRASRQLAVARFDETVMAQRTLALYRQLLDKPPVLTPNRLRPGR